MPDKAHVLLVEDDPGASAALREVLAAEGYSVKAAFSNSEALAAVKVFFPDLVLLDRGLPDGDGMQFCLVLKSDPEFSAIPVLFLTARGRMEEKIMGLKSGDDYLVKPFSMEELKARVGVLLRRRKGAPARQSSLSCQGLVMDLRKRRVTGSHGREIPLRPAEYGLLKLLIERSGEVVSRGLIAEVLRGAERTACSRSALDMTMTRLRGKLAAAQERARIVTVRGRGYLLSEGGKSARRG